MSLLDLDSWPFWLNTVRISVTVLVTAALGAHAWASFRHDAPAASAFRWALALYALSLMFATWANFVILIVSLYAGRYEKGPYQIGLFTLMLVVAYSATASLHARGTRYMR